MLALQCIYLQCTGYASFFCSNMFTHEKKNVTVTSRWAHRELMVTTVVTAPGPMITAQSRLGEVTGQSRRGHRSVTARSQLSHGEVTAHIFSMITAQSRLGHSSITAQVTAQSRLAVTILVIVSSRWAVMVAIFFLMGTCIWRRPLTVSRRTEG